MEVPDHPVALADKTLAVAFALKAADKAMALMVVTARKAVDKAMVQRPEEKAEMDKGAALRAVAMVELDAATALMEGEVGQKAVEKTVEKQAGWVHQGKVASVVVDSCFPHYTRFNQRR